MEGGVRTPRPLQRLSWRPGSGGDAREPSAAWPHRSGLAPSLHSSKRFPLDLHSPPARTEAGGHLTTGPSEAAGTQEARPKSEWTSLWPEPSYNPHPPPQPRGGLGHAAPRSLEFHASSSCPWVPIMERLVRLLLPQTLWGLKRTVSMTDWEASIQAHILFFVQCAHQLFKFNGLAAFLVGPPGPLGGPGPSGSLWAAPRPPADVEQRVSPQAGGGTG